VSSTGVCTCRGCRLTHGRHLVLPKVKEMDLFVSLLSSSHSWELDESFATASPGS